MPARPRLAPGLVVAGWVADLIAGSPAGARHDVVGGHGRCPGGRGGDLVPLAAGRAAQIVAEFPRDAGDDVSAGLVGNSSSRPCMRIDGGREANAADDYSDSAVRSWSE